MNRKESFGQITKSLPIRKKSLVELTLELRPVGLIYVSKRKNGTNHLNGCGYCIHAIPLINSNHHFVCKLSKRIMRGDEKQDCQYNYSRFKEMHGTEAFEDYSVFVE